MTRTTVANLQDRDRLVAGLTAMGLSTAAAEAKSELFARSAATLAGHGVKPSTGALAWYVPGRIEVFGKHTDYAGGRSLIAAVQRGFCATAVPRPDQTVAITDANDGRSCRIPFAATVAAADQDWSNYPRTVVRRLAQNFPGPLQGAEMAFASDLPPAAGMGRSSALMVATFLMLAEINQLARRNQYAREIRGREDLAGYLGTIENGYDFGQLRGDRGVGTFGGSEDHTAMLCSEPNRLGQFAYCPVRRERSLVMPRDHLFVIAASGVTAEKTGRVMQQYNRAARLAAEVVRIWCQATGRDDPHLAAVIASAADAKNHLRHLLRQAPARQPPDQQLIDRFEHFVAESEEIIPSIPTEWTGPAPARLGQLSDRSQRLASALLGNQVPETDYLAASARELGAVAASAFGAGFGGSVWALVHVDQAPALRRQWAARYATAFPAAARGATFFNSHAGPPDIATRPAPVAVRPLLRLVLLMSEVDGR